MPKTSTKKRNQNSLLARGLILAGLLVVAVMLLIIKEKPQAAATPNELPEAQLAGALAAKKPVLAFYHSNNCQSCVEMIDIVNQVIPDFASSVVLVDINVYDQQNAALLQKARIQYIPTLIFYDTTGQNETQVGVMQAPELREKLASISEGR